MTRPAGAERAVDVVRRLAAAPPRVEGRPAFLDGLVLGAMVGAAIAGSTLWTRWQAHRRAGAPPPSKPFDESTPGD